MSIKERGENMIYTVTFNPSLDYIVSVDDFELGMTNRTKEEIMLPGGKGINVSIVLKNLGFESTALGFSAGFVGNEIERRVNDFGITSWFINIDNGCSRINVKLKSSDGTEINGKGPDISKDKLSELMTKLEELKDGDVLVLAGSVPESMPSDIYKDIIIKLRERNIIIVVDATSTLLLNVLPYRPFLIKPNHHELSEIFGVKLESKDEIALYASKLKDMGARNVLVSMGKMGAVFVAEDGSIYEAEAPDGILVNSVGAGDSMVAGFIAGWSKNSSYEEAFAMGVAAGSASAFSENLATGDEVREILNKVKITKK